jgi:PhnB protein
MTRIDVYLAFGGNCREAMTFYKECLGGELTLQTVGESPVAGQLPPEAQSTIMHANLTRGNLVLMGSDMAGEDRVIGDNFALSLSCSSEEELNRCFSKLSAGGKVSYPLKTEFWGATFGQLIDKYGYHWMLSYDKNAQ